MWIIKTTASGELQWQKTIGGTGLDFGYDAFETDEGALIFIGETASTDFPDINHLGGIDLVVLKLEWAIFFQVSSKNSSV